MTVAQADDGAFVIAQVGYHPRPNLWDGRHPVAATSEREQRLVKIRNARTVGDRFDLDAEGFMLFEHRSRVSHLRDVTALDRPYHAELVELVQQSCAADLVLPVRWELYVRSSPRTGDENVNRPSPTAHADIVESMLEDWIARAAHEEGVTAPRHRRAVAFQTWRAVSPPPQDYPLALTDGRSIRPHHYAVLQHADNARYATRLALHDPGEKWFYFPNMREDEVLLFKTYDSAFREDQTVMHTAFDNMALHPNATPRVSIEARLVALWF